MAMSRCIGSLLWLASAVDGARLARSSSATKVIAGVPMYNADKVRFARSGRADYMIMTRGSTSESAALCQRASGACVSKGAGMPYMKFRGTEAELEKLLKGHSSDVMYVEPDLPMALIPDAEPESNVADSSDPSLLMWGLDRVGTPTRPNEGAGVHIYILDTGIRTTHNDFEGRAIPSLDMTSGSAVECDPADLSCAKDGQGHGTHCAGTAAGRNYGVAPSATLHSVKVLGDNGSGEFSWAIGALDFVMSKGGRPAVASMSLGGKGIVEAIATTIEEATAQGVVVVVAGGNSNDDACKYSPAYAPKAITVGSTNLLDFRSIFSNYGACTNIWAPGSQIISAGFLTDWTAVPKDGTSMACPHVSGGAAIVLSANPSLNPDQVLSKLLTNSKKDAISGLKADDDNKFLFVGA